LEAFSRMVRWVFAAGMFLLAGPALAQSGTCLERGLLRVVSAFALDGAAGTYDYAVQVSNNTNRTVPFRIEFRMTGAMPHPQLRTTTFQIAPQGSLTIRMANGRVRADSNRVGGGVRLIC
jgi:hypothetical protein